MTAKSAKPGVFHHGATTQEESDRRVAYLFTMQNSTHETTRVIEEIQGERVRQYVESGEGRTVESDDDYPPGTLALAGASYCVSAAAYGSAENGDDGYDSELAETSTSLWPFRDRRGIPNEHYKPKDARRDLVRAGALIVAEIERLDRKASE